MLARLYRRWCLKVRIGSEELDDMIISLYAGGMTVRDICHHLSTTLGVDMSPDTINDQHDYRCGLGRGHDLAQPPTRRVLPSDFP